jgi:hypothetical protein
MSENRLLRIIFGPKRDEVTDEWSRLHKEVTDEWSRLHKEVTDE